MNSSPTRPEEDPDLARWGLMASALVIGAFLLVFYVHLLQDSVARGAQARYTQASAPPIEAFESTTSLTQIRVSGTRR